MAVDLSVFEQPWEHIRLLSDRSRNEAMLKMLARRAPGKRVLEVGCGTGLLSCIAARMGATKVYAVEPTSMVHEARSMVLDNGLEDIVEVIEGRVEDVEPRPVDVVFSELLNADPFTEGVLPAMAAARPWAVEGGACYPRRLKIWAALTRDGSSARELRQARSQIRGLASRYGLVLERLDALFSDPGSYPHVHHVRDLASAPVLVWDLDIGVDADPDEPVDIELVARDPGPVGGVAVWFECDLDDGINLHNRPGIDGHWGQLVSSFPEEIGLGVGHTLRVRVQADDDGTWVTPIA